MLVDVVASFAGMKFKVSLMSWYHGYVGRDANVRRRKKIWRSIFSGYFSLATSDEIEVVLTDLQSTQKRLTHHDKNIHHDITTI